MATIKPQIRGVFPTPVAVHFLPVAQDVNLALRPLIVELVRAAMPAFDKATAARVACNAQSTRDWGAGPVVAMPNGDLIVTPRMHGIHHSQVQRENNSNFGTVFPWWDRLHRTLGLNIPQSEIVVGVPGYSRPEDNTVPNALLMPFRKQRDYWRDPNGAVVERGKNSAEPNPGRLAE